jgi:endogenous inhibitor of DNA gyrase (YacG/DUF329 family)
LQSVRTVSCPRCGAQAPFSPENKWRPFCSERCKLIDLGAWASQAYRVPAETEPAEGAEPEKETGR